MRQKLKGYLIEKNHNKKAVPKLDENCCAGGGGLLPGKPVKFRKDSNLRSSTMMIKVNKGAKAQNNIFDS